MKRKFETHRENFSYLILHYLLSLAGKSLKGPILGIILLLGLPVVLYACSVPEDLPSDTGQSTSIRLMGQECNTMDDKGIDVLIFNNNEFQKLDTYQKIKPGSCAVIKASSSAGEKIFTIISNSGKERYDWVDVSYRDKLKEKYFRLEEEEREKPLMSGEHLGKAGFNCNINMQKLRAEIVLRSISCDFSGKTYEACRLKNTKVYLSNVNAEAAIINDEPYTSRRIINRGGLNMGDLEAMKDPGMLLQEIRKEIGSRKIYPDIRLCCYPNESSAEDLGNPFTRLVIEGEIDGRTYYWPLNINRDKGGNGISRNCSYIYDITIKRTGHTKPDIAIDFSDTDTIIEVKEWEEREEYGVRF